MKCRAEENIKPKLAEHRCLALLKYSSYYYSFISFYMLFTWSIYLNVYFVIQINHQPDATVFQFIVLTSIYSSTCFGRFPAHHQELNDCSGSLWFYLCIVVIVVPCSWSGRLNCCIWLVIYLNCTMMHGLTNLKFIFCTRQMWRIYSKLFAWPPYS